MPCPPLFLLRFSVVIFLFFGGSCAVSVCLVHFWLFGLVGFLLFFELPLCASIFRLDNYRSLF